MPRTIIRKQLVCSECGRPLKSETVTAGGAERLAAQADDDMDDDLVQEDQGLLIDTIVETGPVCPRCADYR